MIGIICAMKAIFGEVMREFYEFGILEGVRPRGFSENCEYVSDYLERSKTVRS